MEKKSWKWKKVRRKSIMRSLEDAQTMAGCRRRVEMRIMNVPGRPTMLLDIGIYLSGSAYGLVERENAENVSLHGKGCFYLEPLNWNTKTMLRRGKVQLNSLSLLKAWLNTKEIIRDVHKYAHSFCHIFIMMKNWKSPKCLPVGD